MNELNKFTTAELIDEIKRRSKNENFSVAITNHSTEYDYATGEIIRSGLFGYRVLINEEDALKYNIDREPNLSIRVMSGVFSSKKMPKTGDHVRMKCRKTKACPKFNASQARIFEVIKDE